MLISVERKGKLKEFLEEHSGCDIEEVLVTNEYQETVAGEGGVYVKLLAWKC